MQIEGAKTAAEWLTLDGFMRWAEGKPIRKQDMKPEYRYFWH